VAQLDDGNDRAIVVQGDEGSAQVIRLGHRGTPSRKCGDEVAIPRRPPHSVYRFPVAKETNPGTGTVREATKVRLQAVAYLPGTDGSNPFRSSGESANYRFPSGGQYPD
jgi:hypothetical protein